METGLGGGVELAGHVLRAKRICGLPSLTLWPYYFDTADLPHRRRTDALSLAYPISTAVAAREHDTVHVVLLY